MEYKTGDIIISRYEVVDVKRGGFGIVYISRDREYGIGIAIKTFQDRLFEEGKVASAFYHEAEVWVKLGSHENIVTAFYVTYIDEKPHLLLEWIDGGTLGDWIKKGRLDNIQILQFAVQFCNGMIQANDVDLGGGKKGLVHRDIKPGNIMFTKEGLLKVTDFGLVKALGAPSAERPAGTPEYMSPEQFHTMDVDQRSDIYSFGAVMYEMLTGTPPFYTDIEEERWNYCKHHHQEVMPKPLRQVNSAVPQELEQVVLMCLAKHPENRYQTFKGLKNDLEKIDREIFGGKVEKTVVPLFSLESKLFVISRARVWVFKGFSLECLGKFKEALACFDMALKLNSSDAIAWIGKGIVLKDLGEHKNAVKCFDEALRVEPRNDLALVHKGLSLFQMNKPSDALVWFNKALEVDMNNSEAWNGKGISLNQLGKTMDAVKCFERAIQIERNHADAWYNLGFVFYGQGNYNEALRHFEMVLKINARRADAWNSRGACLLYLGKVEEALKAFEKALEISPSNERYKANREAVLKLLRK